MAFDAGRKPSVVPPAQQLKLAAVRGNGADGGGGGGGGKDGGDLGLHSQILSELAQLVSHIPC